MNNYEAGPHNEHKKHFTSSITNCMSMDAANIKNSAPTRPVLLLCMSLAAILPGLSQAASNSPVQTVPVTPLTMGKTEGVGQSTPTMEVYKSAQCGCCKSWAEYLQKNGFKVIQHDVEDVPAIRKKLGMPSQYGSCHTARIGSYLIEGHVPASDIKRLLRERPQAIGLAVPSMPPGSPGMESDQPVRYNTLLIDAEGRNKIFAQH